MSVSVTFNGNTYSIPSNREPRGWGTSLSSFLVAVGNNALSKAGGSFVLTADINFGTSFGLVAPYLKSASANIAQSGVLRLANNEGIAWRNAANGADVLLKVNASDRLEVDGVVIPTLSSTDTLTNKTIDGDDNTVQDLALTSLKTDLANAGKFIERDVSGIVVSGKAVPTGDVVGTSDSQSLTNKTLVTPVVDDYLELNEETAPGSPSAGAVRVYAKNDKKLYTKDSNGVESQVGAGSSGGVTFFYDDLENGSTSNYATYDDGASATPVDGTGGSASTLTISASSSSPLRGTYSLAIAKSAADGQGEGVAAAFSIPSGYQQSYKRRLAFLWDGTDANYVGGDMVCYIYDVTNGVLIPPSVTSLPATKQPIELSWDSSTSASYRLIFHVATTSALAYTVKLDDVTVDPGRVVNGYPGSGWVSFTPAITLTGVTWTWNALYRRVGDSAEVVMQASSSGGTCTGGTAVITLPFTIDAVKQATSGASHGRYGAGSLTKQGGSSYPITAQFSNVNGATFTLFSPDLNANISDSQPTNFGDTSGDKFSISFTVPIAEWADSGINLLNVNRQSPLKAGIIAPYAGATAPTGWLSCDGSTLSQADYPDLYAALGSTWDTCRNQSTGSNYSAPSAGTFRLPDLRGSFVRGAGTSSGYGTTTLAAFQDDATAKNGLAASTASDGGHNHKLDIGTGAFAGNQYRINSTAVSSPSSSSTSYPSSGDNPTTAADGQHNHTITVTGDSETRPANVGVNYIIKVWNDSADVVGFGAATATSMGLVKGGTVPGSTAGTAIATGYVGQKITATISGSLTNMSTANTIASIPLTAGVWMVYANLVAANSGNYPAAWSTRTEPFLNLSISTSTALDPTCQARQIVVGTTSTNEDIYTTPITRLVTLSADTTYYFIVSPLISNSPTFTVNTTNSQFYAVRIA